MRALYSGMKSFFLLLICCRFLPATAQVNGEIAHIPARNEIQADSSSPVKTRAAHTVSIKSFIVPAVLVTYGALAVETNALQKFNISVNDEVKKHFPSFKSGYDNFAQYAPTAAVFVLQAFKIKGTNSVKDELLICLLANGISTAIVTPVKHVVHEQRPDGSNRLSFPSGHTATAFAAAEFLRREYKAVSPWIGIAGYAVAASTGIFRMLNQKHWLSDVAAGAGIGIASTNAAYWLYPKIKKAINKNKPMNTIILPMYQQGNIGLGLVHTF